MESLNKEAGGLYRKSSIKLPGGLFNFGPSRGGVNREGGFLERGAYSQNQVTRIYLVAFKQFYDSDALIQHGFIPNHIKIDMHGCVVK